MSTTKFNYTNESKLPALTWIFITYVGAMVLKTLENPSIINSILFTGLMIITYLLNSTIDFFKYNSSCVNYDCSIR